MVRLLITVHAGLGSALTTELTSKTSHNQGHNVAPPLLPEHRIARVHTQGPDDGGPMDEMEP